MKVAFYKGKKHLFNKLVSWWTNGLYSHVEIVLSDGISYSSSYLDNGVRGKKISYNEKDWDFLYLTKWDEKEVKENINIMINLRFDTLGLFSFVFRRGTYTKNKVFCSEFVMSVLGFQEAFRFDTNTAYVTIKNIEEMK